LYDVDDVSETDESSGANKTLTERTLPWKRSTPDQQLVCEAPLKQREFPAWLKNESYIPHGDPSEAVMAHKGT
jgi:hypothetical protein